MTGRTTLMIADGVILIRRVAFVACLLLTACARSGHRIELPMPPVSTGTAVMHAVHNDALRVVMRDLGSSSFSRLPQELDDPARERAALRVASSRAQALADGADRIAAIADRTGLTADQQEVFLGLAARLRDGALLLRTQADRAETRLIGATMQKVDNTCTACHELFRATAPSLGPP